MFRVVVLFLRETFRLFDGVGELLDQLFVALVGREVEAVEASVASGEPCLLTHLLDAETLGAVAP